MTAHDPEVRLTGVAHAPACICAGCGAPVTDPARLCARCAGAAFSAHFARACEEGDDELLDREGLSQKNTTPAS